VAVTFDDGFMNTRGPIERLLGEGVPVTLFTVTGHVGGTNAWGGREAPGIPTMPLLGWDDLEELVARGAGVGTHTRTHTPLTTVPSKALEEELIGPVRDLAARLGVQARHLAYPYGDVDARVVAAAAAHYECACTTEFRAVSPAADSLRLPRLDMYYFRARGALEAWGTSRFTLRLAWCRARRTLRAALAGRSSTLRLSTSR
jgi:peptidoglycan/xylan/chitin deacetylase (PgdA/CDA1 family)